MNCSVGEEARLNVRKILNIKLSTCGKHILQNILQKNLKKYYKVSRDWLVEQ